MTKDTETKDTEPLAVAMDSTTMWLIFVPAYPGARGGAIRGMEELTEKERERLYAAWDRTGHERRLPRDDGYMDKRDCYRCPMDEAAVLERWLKRTRR